MNGQRLKHYLGIRINEIDLDLKTEENFVEKKTFCRKCVAKDIKLSIFLGGNPMQIFNFHN